MLAKEIATPVAELRFPLRLNLWSRVSACRFAYHRMLAPGPGYADRAQCKFQDQQGGAQDESDIKNCFKNSAPLLFRADQQSIRRFELFVHKCFVVHAIP